MTITAGLSLTTWLAATPRVTWWPIILFGGLTGVGVALWVVRSIREQRANPENVTIADVANKVDKLRRQMIVQKGTGPPKPAGTSHVFATAGTFTTAFGAGPVSITLPPGKPMSVPAGTVIETPSSEMPR